MSRVRVALSPQPNSSPDAGAFAHTMIRAHNDSYSALSHEPIPRHMCLRLRLDGVIVFAPTSFHCQEHGHNQIVSDSISTKLSNSQTYYRSRSKILYVEKFNCQKKNLTAPLQNRPQQPVCMLLLRPPYLETS
jgi:hypothetical protein